MSSASCRCRCPNSRLRILLERLLAMLRPERHPRPSDLRVVRLTLDTDQSDPFKRGGDRRRARAHERVERHAARRDDEAKQMPHERDRFYS